VTAPPQQGGTYAARGQGGEELSQDYYASAGEPKSVWEVPGATHTGGIEARPRQYERKVVGFFDDALLAKGAVRESP
jgi:fermentation-respiration switch protein FrsA (DUF1100 family)